MAVESLELVVVWFGHDEVVVAEEERSAKICVVVGQRVHQVIYDEGVVYEEQALVDGKRWLEMLMGMVHGLLAGRPPLGDGSLPWVRGACRLRWSCLPLTPQRICSFHRRLEQTL